MHKIVSRAQMPTLDDAQDVVGARAAAAPAVLREVGLRDAGQAALPLLEVEVLAQLELPRPD